MPASSAVKVANGISTMKLHWKSSNYSICSSFCVHTANDGVINQYHNFSLPSPPRIHLTETFSKPKRRRKTFINPKSKLL